MNIKYEYSNDKFIKFPGWFVIGVFYILFIQGAFYKDAEKEINNLSLVYRIVNGIILMNW